MIPPTPELPKAVPSNVSSRHARRWFVGNLAAWGSRSEADSQSAPVLSTDAAKFDYSQNRGDPLARHQLVTISVSYHHYMLLNVNFSRLRRHGDELVTEIACD